MSKLLGLMKIELMGSGRKTYIADLKVSQGNNAFFKLQAS